MNALLYKEFRNIRVFLVFYILIGWIWGNTPLISRYFFALLILIPSLYPTHEDKGDESFINSLPVTRCDIVNSKYLSSFLVCIIIISSFYALDCGFYYYFGREIPATDPLFEMLIMIIFISVINPIFSLMGPEYKLVTIPLYLLFIGIFCTILSFIYPIAIASTPFIVSLILSIAILLIGSYFISLIGYNKREF